MAQSVPSKIANVQKGMRRTESGLTRNPKTLKLPIFEAA